MTLIDGEEDQRVSFCQEQHKTRDAPLLFERSDERVVGIEVGDHLEAALQGDDLAFEVSLQNAARWSNA